MTANATSPPVAKKESSTLIRFFANPLVGLIGTLASIIGVFLAVYFYAQAAKFRELVYYVNPAQAVVVQTGETSRLRVLVGDRELKSDVTTAQIAIWNRGNESLRAGDVLAPITIKTNPPVPILEVKIRKRSRDVIGMALDEKHLDDGFVGVSWNILEEGDGGVIQLVYAGSPNNTKIAVAGVIEGQREIHQLQYSGKISPAAEQIRQQLQLAYLGWFFMALGLLFFGLASYIWWDEGFRRARGLFVISLVVVAGAIFWLLQSRVPAPPFGF